MIAGTSDLLVTVKSAKKAFDEMTNSVGKTFTVFDIGKFVCLILGHMSFVGGKDMPHLPKIIDILE